MQYPDELYHHGIKGMRWGVRNGPPYPLYRQTSAWRRAHPSRGRIGGLASDYNDWVKKQGKKYRENLPNKVKYPVAVTAAGAVGLAAGANAAFTKRALTGIRDNAKNIPWVGPKLIPKAKEKAVKGAKGFFKMTGGKQRLIAAAALLTAAGVYAGVRKKKKARQEEIKRIRKERGKIGEMRETEAEAVKKGKIGKYIDTKPKSKTNRAKSLKSEYDAEKAALKKKLKGVGIAALAGAAAYGAVKGGFKLKRLSNAYGYDKVTEFLKDVDKREFAILAAQKAKKYYKVAGKVGTGLGIAAGANLAIKKIKKSKANKDQESKVKGIFSGENADEKKAKSLSNKIEAERSSAKTVERNGVKIKVQSKKLTESENMERVNNSFRIKRTRGNSENCIACSVTMEARRRGYEVKARTDLAHDDDSETSFKSVAKVYKNAKAVNLGTNAKSGTKAFDAFYDKAEQSARSGSNSQLTQKLKATTNKMPKGASGQICIMFDRWSGHSMYFYKDRNGKTIFYDTQRNKKYTEEQLNSTFIQNSSNIIMQRFDGCSINEKELLKYSK